MKRLLLTIIAVVLTVTTPASALDLDGSEIDYYAENNILFYDPTEAGSCSAGAGTSGNTDYAGNTILNPKQTGNIENNRSTYENAANEADIPWQMIAVVHLRESGLARENPSNGQGIYQFVDQHGGPYPAGPVDDAEFLRQTKLAAQFLKSKNPSLSRGSPPEEIKRTFFAYNGAGEAYINQAISMGFSQTEAEVGEGSPYVMNMADQRRDPRVEPTRSNNTWGQIKEDHGPIKYPANSAGVNNIGAFVVYSSIAGLSNCGGSFHDIKNLDDAVEFMKTYAEDPAENAGTEVTQLWSVNSKKIGRSVGHSCAAVYHANWKAADCGQCVHFTLWFIQKYTSVDYPQMSSHGELIVGNLGTVGVETGYEPRPGAVISMLPRHTGIVLAVLEDGSIITGEQNVDSDGAIAAIKYAPTDWKAKGWSFAYPEITNNGG
jgi:hypothetical protein